MGLAQSVRKSLVTLQHRLGVLLLHALSLSAASVSGAQSAIPGPFTLPAPTGRFAVGTTRWHLVDSTRRETLNDSGGPRQVEVVAWYPIARSSATGAARAPYLGESNAEARAFATLIRRPGAYDSLTSVVTHATQDARPLAGRTPLPLLIFSHGYAGPASAYSALLGDLASHGYVVLSVVHPYEVAAATLRDGAVVTFLDSAGALRAGVAAVQAEWRDEDDVMKRVTEANDEDAQRRLLREYFAAVPKTFTALARWVDDTKLVLDRLPTLSPATIAGKVVARISGRRVGVFGHSMGGVTAGQFCVVDTRCKAGLNLDGIPQLGTMIDATMPVPFLMVYSQRPGRIGASDVIYRHAASRYYRVDVDGTRHLDFSDMNFWGGPLRSFGVIGTIAPERAAVITRRVVREYFDQELLGRPSALLRGARALEGVQVTRLTR